MTLKFDDIPAVAKNHVVHFYEDDGELARTVAAYVREGLSAGGAGVVIATDAHRHDVLAELEDAGIDVTAAFDDGSLTFLDAAVTLAALMPSGRLDRDAFRATIGPVVRGAAAAGGPVHAFGEMVALLWDAGDLSSVMELEMLWNELATELGFALLCAYPTSAVGLPEHAEALGHVCRLHAAAEGADGRPRLEAATRLQVSEHAPRAARQFVSELLRGWRIDEAALEDAQTVISELATNAVVHAGTEFVVSASASSSGVRLSVTDTSSALPIVRPCRPEAERGRGLHVISLLARDWGVDAGPDGKTVWAELRA